MKESMTKNQTFVGNQMKKLVLLLPLFFITMCGEAPVTPPAQACSLPLSGLPANCPPPDVVFCLSLDCPPLPKPKPLIPKEELRGEIDIYEPMHWHQMQTMFQRNARRNKIEQTATKPSDAINNALDDFWEVQNGSDGSTKQEKLL